MRKILAGILFGSVASAGLVAYSWRHSSLAGATSSAPATALSAEVKSLRSAVEELRSREGSRTQFVVISPSGESPAETAPPQNAVTPEPDSVDPAAAEEQQQAMVERLEQRLKSEPVDREWSWETSRKIRAVIEAPSVGGRVVEATCASQLCRVVVGHATQESRLEFGREVASQEPFSQGAIYRYSTKDGELRTTVYVVRDNNAIPDLIGDSSN